MIYKSGVLIKVYSHENNGYIDALFRMKNLKMRVTGILLNPVINATYNIKGDIAIYKTGKVFEAVEIKQVPPVDIPGIIAFLSSSRFEGVGKQLAERIVETFGEQTFEVLDSDIDRLIEVPKLGFKKKEKIKKQWQAQKYNGQVFREFEQYGFSAIQILEILDIYKEHTSLMVRRNPYDLLKLSKTGNFTFPFIDTFALTTLNCPKEFPARVDAGVNHFFHLAVRCGHTCFPKHEFVPRVASLLNVSEFAINVSINAHLSMETFIEKEVNGIIYLYYMSMYLCEYNEASRFSSFVGYKSNLDIVPKYDEKEISLSPKQWEAVKTVFQNRLTIINGGPGTGKTTVIKNILESIKGAGKTALLGAPTGRAAKRMEEATGYPAATIHRMLKFNPKKGFEFDRENPLECDILILDEASMIDSVLMYHVLKSLPMKSDLVLVGDYNQLPSVGAGNILRDLIESKHFAVVTLDQIFRQSEGSEITVAAHNINKGIIPELSAKGDSDFVFNHMEEEELILQEIIDLATKYRKYDFQVLSPMRNNLLGTIHLNEVLQESLNPKKAGKKEVVKYETLFREGDKVIQTVNNYDKDVFNGDIGVILKMFPDDDILVVDFGVEKHVEYEFDELKQLELAYAMTIHKSQGSEYEIVAMPVVKSHRNMLQRTLLYTGITRGKKKVCLFGQQGSFGLGIRNTKEKNRHTNLRFFLDDLLGLHENRFIA
jgi:exodeoxyribonuclease V alpha subunit